MYRTTEKAIIIMKMLVSSFIFGWSRWKVKLLSRLEEDWSEQAQRSGGAENSGACDSSEVELSGDLSVFKFLTRRTSSTAVNHSRNSEARYVLYSVKMLAE